MKRVLSFAFVLITIVGLCAGCAATNGTASSPCGYESLAGCWVGEAEDGTLGAIQFFSDGTCVLKYQSSKDSSRWYYEDLKTYCTESNGTMRLDDQVFYYQRSKDTLTLTSGETVMRLTLSQKDITQVEADKDSTQTQ